MTIIQIAYFSMLGAALLGYAGILCSIPHRRKKIFAQAGSCLMPLKVASSKKWIAIAVAGFILILVVPLRNYSWFVNIILLGTALFAAELAAREAGGCGKAGIYENMLISGIEAILWSDIYSLPTLSYENDPETTQVDFKTLRIILKNNKETQVLFESEEVRKQAVELILKLAPNLRP
ncbi:MAG: hypothetical protein IJJ71_02610 [Treponema sp.]|uniref:hypothetical protein n=1 Tax=Treponema sp. TaxID=166 RepID=UPI0025D873BF|nr:hypothetical protein [Treponema sp.]MBR0495051.1 hypothetical protein [Treponema sp.]